MIKIIKLCILITVFLEIIGKQNKEIFAYGENINGYQTHYELQEATIRNGYLYLTGFYYVYELQNYTAGTHYYYITLTNTTTGESKIYYDYSTASGYGINYKNLTTVEQKEGQSFKGSPFSLIQPKQSNYNYYYDNVGFYFEIPLDNLTSSVNGIKNEWKVSLSIVPQNTSIGNPTFTQSGIYSSLNISNNILFNRYFLTQESEMNTWGVRMYGDVGIVRQAAGKTMPAKTYNGNIAYWFPGQIYYDMSHYQTNIASTGNDEITWYRFQISPFGFYNSRYRVLNSNSSNDWGWVPSVFLGEITGTPYSVFVYNTAPVISSKGLEYNEATSISDEMLLNLITASDKQDGDVTSKVQIVDKGGLNQSKAKSGTYSITYSVTDNNNVTTSTPILLKINNVPPTINAPDKSWEEATAISDAMLLEDVTASDPYDGDLTSGIAIIDKGGLNQNKAKVGTYSIIYSVTDHNNSTTIKTSTITINNVPPVINASNKELNYGKVLRSGFLLRDVTASDIYDGELTSQVSLYDIGELKLDSNKNGHKAYQVTYAVTDSNGATTYKTITLTIVYRYVRFISIETLDTLSLNSKWRNPGLYAQLISILLRDSNDEYIQIWNFSNEDRIAIQKYMTQHAPSEETNQWFLEHYSDRKSMDKLGG